MANRYATVAQLKSRISLSDTLDDEKIGAALDAVSRLIDRYCGRRFFVEQRTRYYTPSCRERLLVDDLLAVTSLKTDHDADRVYETTWATTDYDLEPYNALLESPPEPYTRICLTPLGVTWFPPYPRSVEIVGKWGYYEVLETPSATAAEAIDASETGIDVSDGSAFEAGQTILIDSEQMYISDVALSTLTVTRGVNGTTAATHSNGATIQRYSFPDIGELALQQAIIFFKSYAGGLGEIGSSGEFVQRIAAGLHPFVRQGLETYRRVEFG